MQIYLVTYKHTFTLKYCPVLTIYYDVTNHINEFHPYRQFFGSHKDVLTSLNKLNSYIIIIFIFHSVDIYCYTRRICRTN